MSLVEVQPVFVRLDGGLVSFKRPSARIFVYLLNAPWLRLKYVDSEGWNPVFHNPWLKPPEVFRRRTAAGDRPGVALLAFMVLVAVLVIQRISSRNSARRAAFGPYAETGIDRRRIVGGDE